MDWKKILIFAAVAVYVISPVDLMPGCPIDDIILLLLTVATQRKALGKKEKEIIEAEID